MKRGTGSLLFGLLICATCERPFVEVNEPSIQVVSPDLSEVQLDQVIDLRVQAKSFRPVGNVFVNGAPMQPSQQETDYWGLAISLRPGLNTLILDATDVENVTRTDTAFAVYLSYRITHNAPHLPEARGGHAVAQLPDGRLMVTGGAARAGGLGTGDVFVFDRNSGSFTRANSRLVTPRTGHTATVFSGNRILVAGGSRIDRPSSVSDLVESVELFEPDDIGGTFRELHVEGQPIRRTEHTAVLRNTGHELLLDLLGGQGDTRYGSSPFLGVRQDLRRFRLEGDTLVALNNLVTAAYANEPLFGHTETRIQVGPYFVLGNRFVNGRAIHASLRVDYPSETQIRFSDAPAFIAPRTRHAAAPVLNNLLLIFGGHQNSPSEIVIGMEVLSDAADRFFTLPGTYVARGRYSHAAVTMSNREVLIIGGFSHDGTAHAASEFFVVAPQEQVW